MSRMLVAGLGNVTHPRTRHSVGHYIVDGLAERLGISMSRNRFMDAELGTAEVELAWHKIELTLMKNTLPMNLAGPSVRDSMRHKGVSLDSLVLIHDDFDVRPGQGAAKRGGRTRGHKGVLSVAEAVKTGDFHRLHIGIGGPPKHGDVRDFVLGPLSSYEKQFWAPDGEGIESIIGELEKLVLNNPKTWQ